MPLIPLADLGFDRMGDLSRGDSYLDLLAQLHAFLEPRKDTSKSGFGSDSPLSLGYRARPRVAIDPHPCIAGDLPGHIRVVPETSDEFFQHRDMLVELGGQPVELAFIDGMHQFEFALRDFINLEAASAESALILLHDCYPLDAQSAERERSGASVWTGDVWRTVVALRRYRPDLEVVTLASPPSGLGLVRGLDPGSRVLRDRYEQIVEEMVGYDFSSFEASKDAELNLVAGDWLTVARLLEDASDR